MQERQTDFSIYNKFDFDMVPVGIKFLHEEPDGLAKLDKKLNLCEMPKEAQNTNSSFYVDKSNESCGPGSFPMGWKDVEPAAEYGKIGELLGLYGAPRANYQLFQLAPMINKNVVNYVAFSPITKLTFEPDLLFILASPEQAEIILRATTYSSGGTYESVITTGLACSWLFVYPFKTGKVNYAMTGLGFGMKAKEVYAPGQVMISIPFQKIPETTKNLQEMTWRLPAYDMGRDKFIEWYTNLEI